MKQKTLIVAVAMLLFGTTTTVLAQDDAPAKPKGQWTTSSTPALKASESMFNNWSSSGNSQIVLAGTFFGNYKYNHEKFVWDNIVDLAYGYAWQDLDNSSADSVGGLFESRRKNIDKIDITSALTFKVLKDWGANASANLKTQFDNGYEYNGIGKTAEDSKVKVSGFFAPAYLTTAISFELKRPTWSVSASFLTGKTTFVIDDTLIAHEKYYGVIQDDDFNKNDPSTFNHAYFALGSYVKGMYLKKDLLPKLDLYARAELFYDYKKSDNINWKSIQEFDAIANPEGSPEKTKYTLGEDETWQQLGEKNWLQRRAFETDLDFEVKLDYRFSSHLSANLAVNLKWDTDFSGMGKFGHWQIYQMAGLQILFNVKTPRS